MRSFAPSSLLFSLLSLALLSTAMPTPPPDQQTLLSNAKKAQKLNAQFEELKATDPCKDGATACIDGASAVCNEGSWQLDQCPEPTSCYALPSVRRKGTFLACTLPKIVEGLITNLGASGGINGKDAVSDTGATATVTVTLTLSDLATTPTVTLSSVTETLDPSAAAVALGGLSETTILLNGPSDTPAPTPAPSPSLAGNIAGDPPAATTIFLNDPPTSTGAPTVSSAAAVEPPSQTPSSDGGYSGGYGGY